MTDSRRSRERRGGAAAAEVIAVVDCLGVRIDRCGVRQTDPGRGTAAAIGLGGVLMDIAVIGCFIGERSANPVFPGRAVRATLAA